MPGTFATDLVNLHDAEATVNAADTGNFSVNIRLDAGVKVQGTQGLINSGPAAGNNTCMRQYSFTARSVTNGDHFFPWALMTSLSGAEAKASSGVAIACGDSGGALTGTYPNDGPNNSKIFNVDGSDTNKYSGWQMYCFNPQGVADTTIGTTPTLTLLTDVSIMLRSTIPILDTTFNFSTDALRVGTGHTITAGTVLAPVTIADHIAFDGSNANSYGVIIERGGGFEQNGKLKYGTATQIAITVAVDTGISIVFPDNPVAAGFNEISAQGATGFNTTRTYGDFTAGLASGGCTLKGVGSATFDINANAFGALNFYACNLERVRQGLLNSLSNVRNTNITDSGIITAGGALIEDTTFISGNAANALLISTPTEMAAVKNNSFIGQTNAINIDTAGTYTFDGNKFSGNTFDVENSSTGLVTINPVNGSNPSTVTNTGVGASTVINNSVTVTVSGVTEGTPIKVVADETVGTVTKGDVILSGFADNTGSLSTAFSYETAFDPSGLDVISRARNQGVIIAAIADNGGVFTDETLGASSSTAADMTLLPAVPALNDAYYYGHNEQFLAIKQDVSTVLTFTIQPTIIWEYWNGAAWTALAGVTDNTNGFETTGENKITYTLPNDWATTTINIQGPLYYIRARLSAAGTITQVPRGTKATLDASRYIPYAANRTIVSGTGLSDIANWVKDTISQF